MKKYELLSTDKILPNGKPAFQVRRLADGFLGGYVESEANLDQEGDCFIYYNAMVYDSAQVFGSARVYGDAQVYGNARVYGSAEVFGDALVYGSAEVFGNALVYGNARVSGNARIYGDAWVFGNALVYGNARVYGRAEVCGDSRVFGDAIATKPVLFTNAHKHRITITDNHIAIGCECHTITEWKQNIVEIGKKHGYTDKEILKVRRLLNAMLAQRAC
jgi:hypothetical protein